MRTILALWVMSGTEPRGAFQTYFLLSSRFSMGEVKSGFDDKIAAIVRTGVSTLPSA